ncbi:hypothetical protein [Corynebacterium glutamicum]|nr:hypothetical protein [Corynebacterium glutamicum]
MKYNVDVSRESEDWLATGTNLEVEVTSQNYQIQAAHLGVSQSCEHSGPC